MAPRGDRIGNVVLGVQLEVDQTRAKQQIQASLKNALAGQKINLQGMEISNTLTDRQKNTLQNAVKRAFKGLGIDASDAKINFNQKDLGKQLEKEMAASIKEMPQLDLGTKTALAQAEGVKVRVRKLLDDVEKEGKKPRQQILHNFEVGLNRSLAGIGLNVRSLAALLGAGITGSLVVAGLRLVAGAIAEVTKTALEMHEAVASSNAVFGDASRDIQDFAQNSRAALFLTKQEAIEAATEIGLVFRLGGASQQGAADIAKALETAVINLTALQGSTTGVSKGLTALREALKGDTQDLIRLGLVYNDFDIKNKAVELGLIKTGEQLTANNQALVTARLVISDTAKVSGEAAKRAEDAAGGFRGFMRNVEDLKLALGNLTLGPLSSGAKDAAIVFGTLAGAIDKAREAYDKLPFGKKAKEKSQLSAAQKEEEKQIKAATKAIDEAIDKRGKAEQVLQRLRSNPNIVIDVAQAQHRLEGANLSVEKSALSLEQAQNALNQAQARGEKSATKLSQAQIQVEQAAIRSAQAQISLERATLGQERAERNILRIQEDIADLPQLHEFQDIQAAINLEQAERALTTQLKEQLRTVRELARAHEDVEDAYHRLARVSKSAAAGQRDIRDAQRGVLDAQDRIEQLKFQQSGEGLDRRGAELNLRQAQFSSARLDNRQLRETQDLNDQLIDANFQLRDSKLAIKSASLEVRAAEIGEKEAAFALKNEELELRAAQLAVVDARHAMIGSAMEAAIAEADLDAATKLLNGQFQTVGERTDIFTRRLGELGTAIKDGEVKGQLGELAGSIDANANAYRNAIAATEGFIKAQDKLAERENRRKKKLEAESEKDKRNIAEKAIDFLEAISRTINPLLRLLPRYEDTRHSGGAVMKGRPYVTRENELFVPSSHGRIHPPETAKKMTSSSPTTVNLNVNKPVDVDENVLARQLARHINRRIPSV